jgi:hypothetical protein
MVALSCGVMYWWLKDSTEESSTVDRAVGCLRIADIRTIESIYQGHRNRYVLQIMTERNNNRMDYWMWMHLNTQEELVDWRSEIYRYHRTLCLQQNILTCDCSGVSTGYMISKDTMSK